MLGAVADYRFEVEALDLAGSLLGSFELPGSTFEAAARAVHLDAMRRGTVPVSATLPAVRLTPVFGSDPGAPYVEGVEVNLDPGGGRTFAMALFHDEVVRGAQSLVARGVLTAGQRFGYRVQALPTSAAGSDDAGAPFLLEPAAADIEVRIASRPDGECHGPADHPDDIPVIVRRSVLDEAIAYCAGGGGLERGGMLLGRLCRDPGDGVLFVDIHAVLVAESAQGTELSLRFSPDTFAELERQRATRDPQESLLGWVHSHPYFCARCPEAQRRACRYRRPFFSEADRDVHRALFPQAYSQALLISQLGQERPAVDLFSWRAGAIHSRGFVVAAAGADPGRRPAVPA